MTFRIIAQSTIDLFHGILNPDLDLNFVPCQFECGLYVRRYTIHEHLLKCNKGPQGEGLLVIKYKPFFFSEEQIKLRTFYRINRRICDYVWGRDCFNCDFIDRSPQTCICQLYNDDLFDLWNHVPPLILAPLASEESSSDEE